MNFWLAMLFGVFAFVLADVHVLLSVVAFLLELFFGFRYFSEPY